MVFPDTEQTCFLCIGENIVTHHWDFRKTSRAVSWRVEGSYGQSQGTAQKSGVQIEEVMVEVERQLQIGELLKREADSLY